MALARRLANLQAMGRVWRPLLLQIQTVGVQRPWPSDWSADLQLASLRTTLPQMQVDASPKTDALDKQSSDDEEDRKLEEPPTEDTLVFDSFDDLETREHQKMNRLASHRE